MNITAGRGGMAWEPSRLSVWAFAAPPFDDAPDEVLGPEIIAASLQFGPLGTLTKGNLSLAEVPDAWQDRMYPRLVRLRLESEHGTGYIAAGIVESALEARGGLSNVPLVGVQAAYLDGLGPKYDAASGYNFPSALDGGVLTPGGVQAFGVSMPNAYDRATRRSQVDKMLEPHPNSEAGVSADLVGIIGRPEGAHPATYTVDSRALDLVNRGYVATDYVSDAVWEPGSNFSSYNYTRTDTPLFVPRRTGAATGEVLTREYDKAGVLAGASSPLNTWYSTGPNSDRAWDWTMGIYPPEGEVITSARLYITFEAEVLGGTLRFIPTIYARGPGAGPVTLPSTDHFMSGIFTLEFEIDPATLKPWLDSFPSQARVVVRDTLPDSDERNNRYRILAVGTRVVRETPGADTAQMPVGWRTPYWAGPTHEFRLGGVHVPPLLVHELPGGLSQYAAGADVTWNRGEASTRILTAALPYPGQRRR